MVAVEMNGKIFSIDRRPVIERSAWKSSARVKRAVIENNIIHKLHITGVRQNLPVDLAIIIGSLCKTRQLLRRLYLKGLFCCAGATYDLAYLSVPNTRRRKGRGWQKRQAERQRCQNAQKPFLHLDPSMMKGIWFLLRRNQGDIPLPKFIFPSGLQSPFPPVGRSFG